MASKPFTKITNVFSPGKAMIIKWVGLANGDDGLPFKWQPYRGKSVHILGTFGAGGTVVLEGSNADDVASYVTLNDPQGNPISVSSEKIEEVLENVYAVRPRVIAGDGTTDIDVFLLVTR